MNDDIYRPGLEGVIAGETAISAISDGLRYRGYSIEDLAANTSFEEVAYLILRGDLPNAEQFHQFRQRLSAVQVDDQILNIITQLPNGTPLMDVLRTGTSLLSHWETDVTDNRRDANLNKSERLLSQLPILLAARYRYEQGLSAIPPDSKKSLAENLLLMLHGETPDPSHVRAMDISLILYAEHEYNASTFTSRVVCSTLSDMHSSITAAIGALKGPLHGGANERVMEVLEDVGSPDRAESWVRDALARKVRIMGFGHRVYKTGDPRAQLLKNWCVKLATKEHHRDMEKMADIIEQAVTGEKGLPPNLDWPSARLYHYMGLPVPLYTPLFVLSRVVGWAAHVIEQLDNNRLIRPRSRYTGPDHRDVISLSER